MRYRKLDEAGDRVFGHGLADFWIDQPEAVAQAALTRVEMFVGDWYLAPANGTPWRTEILGKGTEASRDPAIQARVLGTPGCLGLTSYASRLDRDTRGLFAAMTIETVYGQISISRPR